MFREKRSAISLGTRPKTFLQDPSKNDGLIEYRRRQYAYYSIEIEIEYLQPKRATCYVLVLHIAFDCKTMMVELRTMNDHFRIACRTT